MLADEEDVGIMHGVRGMTHRTRTLHYKLDRGLDNAIQALQ